jgi:hypothetical protein
MLENYRTKALMIPSSCNAKPLRTVENRPPILFLIDIILPRPLSNTLGKASKRRVWPVGAVSKTIVSNFML